MTEREDYRHREMAKIAMAEMGKRLKDYEQDVVATRDRLVRQWRAAHPEAAAEAPSAKHRPLDQIEPGDPKNIAKDPEIWVNDIYQVAVRRWPDDPVFQTRGGMIQIGIHSLDGVARHDWRAFQGIKNQIAGEECEGFELYPAESRLLDPSNYYSLWCFPGLKRIKVGINEERRVWDADEAWAPQRRFEK